jgi:hypothetical protein
VTRFVDSGAKFAGWVGLGMALVVVIAFALIIPIQTIVFVLAPLMGAVIGVYANVRAERWRPRGPVLFNSVWAGLVTGIGLALLYVLIRLVFLYGDSGALPNGSRLECASGPDCTYQRYVIAGDAATLAARGITDGASYARVFMTQDMPVTGGTLLVLTVGGALLGGLVRSFSSPPKGSVPLPRPARTALPPARQG